MYLDTLKAISATTEPGSQLDDFLRKMATYVMNHYPLTDDDCEYLLSREIDNQTLGILHRVYPNGGLPLDRYVLFSVEYQVKCLSCYEVSDTILGYELSRADLTEEVLGADLFQDRLIALVDALYDRGRYEDTDSLYVIHNSIKTLTGS